MAANSNYKLDENEKMFSFIKDGLLTFDYPLAHSMSLEELGDIFKPLNRCFLICWMLKLLDSCYDEALEGWENEKDILANFIHELGFCTSNEKLPFMTGELPLQRQVKIIYNIFTHIRHVKRYNELKSQDSITNVELLDLFKRDINLFPSYGEIKRLENVENCLTDFEEDLTRFKTKLRTDTKDETVRVTVDVPSEVIQEFLEKFRDDFPKVKAVIKDFDFKDNPEARRINLNSVSAGLLKRCCENLKIISQLIKDINTIEDFRTSSIEKTEPILTKNRESYDMIKVLYQEVMEVIKYAK